MTRTLHALDDPGADGSPASEPIRVLIAEPHALVRAGLRLLIERQEDMRVAAEAATGEDAVAAARTTSWARRRLAAAVAERAVPSILRSPPQRTLQDFHS